MDPFSFAPFTNELMFLVVFSEPVQAACALPRGKAGRN